MGGESIDIGELIKNFRVGFDKAGLAIYVVPRRDTAQLIRGEFYSFNNEDVQLYGTKVTLHLPCSGAIYGRYLVRINDNMKGLYVVITDAECDVDISWREEGLGTRISMKPNEALVVIIRLMRLRARKIRPNSYALRIMRVLNLSGKLLYSDANQEIQVFGIRVGAIPQFQGTCVSEFNVGQWKFILSKCGFVTEVLNDGSTIALLISNTGSIAINRYFPSLNKWYELRKVSGFDNYLIVLKGEV